MPRMPSNCPSCAGLLQVSGLSCSRCGVRLEGEFELPPLSRLAPGQQEFVLTFLRARGNIKEVERVLGVSYPTVRNRLDALIEKVKSLQAQTAEERED